MLGFISGLLYANAIEWFAHKYLLHEEGKKKDSFWRFHWADHHKLVRQNNFRDISYEKSLLEWNPQSKELFALTITGIVHLPLVVISPSFVTGLYFSGAYYYYVHKKAHLDPDWAMEFLPWHYDHHMGADQDKNFCVTFPLFDYVMGTRVRYIGTKRELEDKKRRLDKIAAT
ncbi:MAG: sterol desaturase family protein [Leptospiraceae bacterium]|nr:sterol desaturase family protein [Leptospiraceae bacterium]